MKFSEFPYRRVETAEVKEACNACIAKLTQAADYATAREAFLEYDKYNSTVDTYGAISYVRHTINTNDKFYSDENDYWDSASPEMQESSIAFIMAMLQSKFRPEFEKEFGSVMFINAELALKSFSPQIVSDMQEENVLVSDYAKLIAGAQIDFQGEKRTIAQMSPFKTSADDEVRRAAWLADGNFYVENAEKLDNLYDSLVKKRTEMGRKLGYENYTQLGYYRMHRNCYDMEDVSKFREAVKKYIVPIAYEIKKKQAERTGVGFPLTFADDVLDFRSGNPRPCIDSDGILANGKKMYEEMSEETKEFIGKMFESEMFDVVAKTGKAAGGYCIGLPDYKLPFIFANFNGTQHDVEVITHEAGHAFAGYMCRNIVPGMNSSPSLESCEVHSMSMEFFAWPWAELFFGKDTDKFLYSHLAGAITFIPYGTMVDEFQHIVYQNPDLTPAERHAEWARLEGIYRPWLKLDGSAFYGEGKGWQRQTHIYERPFYYIDYCLAQSVALRFWALMREDREDAWQRYLAFVKKGGTETFKGLIAGANIETPFGEEALKKIAKAAQEFLDGFDSSKLV